LDAFGKTNAPGKQNENNLKYLARWVPGLVVARGRRAEPREAAPDSLSLAGRCNIEGEHTWLGAVLQPAESVTGARQ
jgi:hypothetical protein